MEGGWHVEQCVGSDARLLGPGLLLALAAATAATATAIAALGRFVTVLVVLKLLGGGNTGLTITAVAAVLS